MTLTLLRQQLDNFAYAKERLEARPTLRGDDFAEADDECITAEDALISTIKEAVPGPDDFGVIGRKYRGNRAVVFDGQMIVVVEPESGVLECERPRVVVVALGAVAGLRSGQTESLDSTG